MRKYFLLSAVALLLNVSNVMATTDATAQLSAQVTLIVPTQVDCSSIDFGTLYLNKSDESNISSFKMDTDGTIMQNSLQSGYELMGDAQGTVGICQVSGQNLSPDIAIYLSDTQINLNDDNSIYVADLAITRTGQLKGTLYIENNAEITSGQTLNGNTTVLFTY